MGRCLKTAMRASIVLLLLSIVGVRGKKAGDVCASKGSSCGSCISAHPSCSWCSQEEFEGASRCFKSSNATSCRKQNIVSPQPAKTLIVRNEPVTRRMPIGPQDVQLTLRRGSKATMAVVVKSKKGDVSVKFRIPRAVRVQVKSKCKGFKYENNIATCKDARKVRFRLRIKLKRCLPKPKKIKVIVNGNKKKTLKVTVKSMCECDCESPGEVVKSSPRCYGQGDMVCGKCKCKDPYFGDNCICTPEDGGDEQCRPRPDKEICFGRGKCMCGTCSCNKGVVGRFCECDNNACSFSNGAICGGPDNGVCKCGQCLCNPGFSGEACGYSLSTATCISEGSREICSGHGKCIGGVCSCEKPYAGMYCEHCPGGDGGSCECDNNACSYTNGAICGGPAHGVCRCGQCQCKPLFTGEACGISLSTDMCMSDESSDICNGHGLCKNNRCVCNKPYSGQFCEDCPTCAGKCGSMKSCVQCHVFGSGPLSPVECEATCRTYGIEIVDDVAVRGRTDPPPRLCLFKDDDNCLFTFGYTLHRGGRRTIKVQRNKMCS